jgi:hypothetical protein
MVAGDGCADWYPAMLRAMLVCCHASRGVWPHIVAGSCTGASLHRLHCVYVQHVQHVQLSLTEAFALSAELTPTAKITSSFRTP